MEDASMVRLSPLRPGGGLKSPSGKSTPRGSPSFRRLNSGRSQKRDGRIGGGYTLSYCFRSNRVVLWLLLISLWAYAGFYFQSRWAHGDNKEDLFSGGYGGESNGGKIAAKKSNRRDLIVNLDSKPLKFKNETIHSNSENVDSGIRNVPNKSKVSKKRSKKSRRSSRRKNSSKVNVTTHDVESEDDLQVEEIPKQNTTYGFLVGPFGSVEDSILEWSPDKRSGTCDRKGAFARLVWSRKFVLIFHELTTTGAPLAMMELATEFLSCGATISVIVLNKKGSLMPELKRRKIKVLVDKTELSFKVAMRANLIIAGSAVCSSWIEQYRSRTPLGSSQIMWWIMENRREYFDRSKHLLSKVKKLIFLSESQSKQWLAWSKEEKIKLKDEPALVPLSVNDELAFVAGLSCSLNTPTFNTTEMMEKRQLLRNAVRQEMGLKNDDMLAVSLSSINPGKGQLLVLESVRLVIEQGREMNHSGHNDSVLLDDDYYSRVLLQNWKRDGESSSNNVTLMKSEGLNGENLKILIGSVGSKSNKVAYVKTLLEFLSMHSNLSKSVVWTPATTRVASLYSAADVYVMNSQGIGETFGRVTIEAMAFGLPVLGTDCGGTKEIVEHNVTGLLHSVGRPGARVLARNLEFLLENPEIRQEMGMRGREKVEKMYLKRHMFQKFGEVLYNCMRIK